MTEKPRVYPNRTFAAKPGRVVQLAGQQFGALTVIERSGRVRRNAAWLCRCACGNEIIVSSAKLLGGRRKSCGIGHRFFESKPPRVPSLTSQYRSEYSSWQHMHARCKNKKHHRFPHYGGRGIKVCTRWDSFENFMLDMGRKPDPKFTIERIDVNRDYEPGNCKWISRTDQSRNRTDTVMVTYQGKKQKLIDVVGQLGISRNVIYQRLRLGWPLDVALALPVRPKKPRVPKGQYFAFIPGWSGRREKKKPP